MTTTAEHLRNTLDGRWRDVKNQVRDRLTDEVFRPHHTPNTVIARAKVAEQMAIMAAAGAADDGFRKEHGGNGNVGAAITMIEMLAMSDLEAIPGHHLQLAIANERTDLPAFRRMGLGHNAFIEGWGLYSERLAEEMGLYEDDLDRLGMLVSDAWRACRLVVDTGLHARGWSRQQAIDFMAEYAPLDTDTISVEVDRYIGMPGQALSYKVGQREILKLRAEAQAALGDRFDIKDFHDTVLGAATVSLAVLRRRVAGWIAQQH